MGATPRYDVAVIGSGIAGLTAGALLARQAKRFFSQPEQEALFNLPLPQQVQEFYAC